MKTQRTRISAYGLIIKGNEILLCRLSAELPRWHGYWTLPGGEIEFGEAPEAAVIREVEEETGLIVKVISICHVDSIVDVSGDDDFHGIRLIYNVEVIGGELRNELKGSTDLAAWVSSDELKNIKLVDLAEVGVSLFHKEKGEV
eukprot:Seg13836.2 transcript_id=Seg13836.2/GoldUCD/mRNA.D3Y31 product="ADP-ribose pyrophosphatase" protein_id=Seg13836.2/GoldUCD/D3Y31